MTTTGIDSRLPGVLLFTPDCVIKFCVNAVAARFDLVYNP